ncbi:MAG: carbohydrate ABC transporter substrate-binding protein [Chitinophagaceae bacterium]|nr:carbohydrate ABC transporter substrate-binding protein [Rubrivivax sp.]
MTLPTRSLHRWNPTLSACAASLVLLCLAGSAAAQRAEVVHWWTSKGESAAVQELAKAYTRAGGTWIDAAIAGGENARNTTINRMSGGKPPTVAQFSATSQFQEIVEEGLLNDIDAVAQAQDWDRILPEPLKKFVKFEGKYFAAPLNIHNPSWFWYSKAVLAKAGVVGEPRNMTEFFAALDKIKASGAIPLALGGQNWQESILFYTVLHTSGGADLYRRFFANTDGSVALSPEFKQVLSDFKRLKAYVDAGSPNRDWNLAAALVITNKAGFQIIGDYVKAEFAGAGKVAGTDYGCFPGFGPKAPYIIDGDVFVFPKSKTRDPAFVQAQRLFATVVTSRETQVAFNLKKGSLPIRTDVDLGPVDICTQLGMQALKDPSRHLPSPEQIVSPDKNAAIGDAITKFWNTNQTVEQAARALARAAAIRL